MFGTLLKNLPTRLLRSLVPFLSWAAAATTTAVSHGAQPLEDARTQAGENAPEIRVFLTFASDEHGDLGGRAASYLIANMPERDLTSLSAEFLIRDFQIALQTRNDHDRFPWNADLPEDLFLEYVLPYAVLDETRDPWREDFLALASPLVTGARSRTEAAQTLNREFFNLINVHYSTERDRANQSARESIEINKASCTGLSIILVNACRALGIPARVVGIPVWANKRGNHTWVEIWDGGWHFTGADEYTPEGLNRGWFVNDAAQSRNDAWEHTIYASRWSQTGQHFPMVWDLSDRSVAALDVTHRYAANTPSTVDQAVVFLRVRDQGKRIAVPLEVRGAMGKIVATERTRAAPADLNDMPALRLPPDRSHLIRLQRNGETREIFLPATAPGSTTLDVVWDELPVVPAALVATENWLARSAEERSRDVPTIHYSRAEADRAQALLWAKLVHENAPARAAEWERSEVEAAGKTMRFLSKTFGDAPVGDRSLWISLHGGGGTAAAVNDGQWRNQIRLYEPEEGIYIAPRAPTNSWNLWHESHIDPLFDRLIENAIVAHGVNPNRVFLLGYSAGGDGVYQVAPRMADRWAAAAMMAGHPNDSSPLSLRNLPFAIFMGAKDAAFNRNQVAAEWGHQLTQLQQNDPGGYPHRTTIYEGLGHWMNGRDADALPWMTAYDRNPWPTKIVWKQGNVLHDRFYWLAMPTEATRREQSVTVSVRGQTIDIESQNVSQITLRLSDQLLDLDLPIRVRHAGKTISEGRVNRSLEAIATSFQQRLDPASAATASLALDLTH